MVIKCARGDTPTRSSLFNGLSDNKMVDTFNSDRYTIIKQYFKLKAPNTGAIGGETGGAGSGLKLHSDQLNEVVISRATKVVKLWILPDSW